ncbi:helicase carboxy-terminal domain protein [Pelomyxa schiedti]|nr:helicase carboxy-terminal domain protein [Pelomyxa schiedti]
MEGYDPLSQANQVCLEKLLALCPHFRTARETYHKMVPRVHESLASEVSKVKCSVSSGDFAGAVLGSRLLKDTLVRFEAHVEPTAATRSIGQIESHFLTHLRDVFHTTERCCCVGAHFDKGSEEQLSRGLSVLQVCIDATHNVKELAQVSEQASDLKGQLVFQITTQMENLHTQITQQEIKGKLDFSRCRQQFLTMKVLWSLPFTHAAATGTAAFTPLQTTKGGIRQIYSRTQSFFATQVHSLVSDFVDTFDGLHAEESVDLSPLTRRLKQLKLNEWLEEAIPGCCTSAMREVEDCLKEHMESHGRWLDDVHLDVDCNADLTQLTPTLLFLEAVTPLEAIPLAAVVEMKKKLLERIRGLLGAVLDGIQDAFDLEKHSLSALLCEVENLRATKSKMEAGSPAYLFLAEKGYRDVRELERAIEDNKGALSALVGPADLVESTNKMELQLKRFRELQASWVLTPQQRQLLLGLKVTSIVRLDRCIEEKVRRYEALDRQGLLYNFDQVDPNHVVDSLSFMKVLSKELRCGLYNDLHCTQIKRRIEEFMTRYCDTLAQRVSRGLENISDNIHHDVLLKISADDVAALLDLLPELKELVSNPTLKQFFRGHSSMVEEIKATLSQIASYLEHNSEVSVKGITTKLANVSSLCPMETILWSDSRPFSQLRRALLDQQQEQIKHSAREVFVALEKDRWMEVGQCLSEICESGSQATIRSSMAQVNTQLQRYCNDLKIQVSQLSPEVSDQWFSLLSNIGSCLDKLKMAVEVLSTCRLPHDTPSSCRPDPTSQHRLVKDIELECSKSILSAMASLVSLVWKCQYTEALTKVEIVKKAQKAIRSHLSEEASHSVDDFEVSLRASFQSLIDHYKSVKIVCYHQIFSPKLVFKQLSPTFSSSMLCKENWEAIEDAIKHRFHVDIAQIQEMQAPFEQKQKLLREVAPLHFLPETLSSPLEKEISQITASLDAEHNRLITEKLSAFENEDPPEILRIWNTLLRGEGRSGPMVQNMEVEIDKILRTMCTFAVTSFSSGNFTVSFQNIKKVFTLSELQSDISSIHIPIDDMCLSVHKSLEKTFSFFSDQTLSVELDSTLSDALAQIIELHKVWQSYSDLPDFLRILIGSDFTQRVNNTMESIGAYLRKLEGDLNSCLSSFDVTHLQTVLDRVHSIPFFSTLCHQVVPSLSWKDFYSFCLEKVHDTLESVRAFILEVEICNPSISYLDKGSLVCQPIKSRLNFLKHLWTLKIKHQDLRLTPKIIEEQTSIVFGKITNISQCMIGIVKEYKLTVRFEDKLVASKLFHSYFTSLRIYAEQLEEPFCAFIQMSVNEVKRNLWALIESGKKNLQMLSDVSRVAEELIALKQTGEHLFYSEEVTIFIEAFIQEFKQRHCSLYKLGCALIGDNSGMGIVVAHDSSSLKAFLPHTRVFAPETRSMEYILTKLEGEDIDSTQIAQLLVKFDSTYSNLRRMFLVADLETSQRSVIKLIKNFSLTTEQNLGVPKVDRQCTGEMTDSLPELLAHIFMLWTLSHAGNYFEIASFVIDDNDKDKYLYIPHPAQVVAILRMLGVGYKSNTKVKSVPGLIKNIIQLQTEEGKSVVLGVVSIVLALYGMQVTCACYSSDLCERDWSDFKHMFSLLDVDLYIQHGTFDVLCEAVLNKNGDLREGIKRLITEGIWPVRVEGPAERPHVLLVDEIDVFFNKDFYGNVYSLSSPLQDPCIMRLTDFIWESRATVTAEQVQATPAYKQCVTKLGDWSFLVDSAVADMLLALKTYSSHDYIVSDGKIGYKEQDGVSFSVVFGYNTLFAYYHEVDQGNITRPTLELNVGLIVRAGSFSYAELPKKFSCIMGVTGTLEHLSPVEKEIMRETYGIAKETYIPSVYGETHRTFALNRDIKIVEKERHFAEISAEIKSRIQGRTPGTSRAVLVFFESRKVLMEFYRLEHTKFVIPFKIITEEGSRMQRKALLNSPCRPGHVLLLTSSLGLRLEFSSFANYGLHVIQTFLYENWATEEQIIRRATHFYSEVSFSIVLLDESLQRMGMGPAEVQSIRNSEAIYSTLMKYRCHFYNRACTENSKFLGIALVEHTELQEFVHSLYITQNSETAKSHLQQKNISINKHRSILVCPKVKTQKDPPLGQICTLLPPTKSPLVTKFQPVMNRVIILMVDASNSAVLEDIKNSLILFLLESLEGVLICIISFSEGAYIQCPFTRIKTELISATQAKDFCHTKGKVNVLAAFEKAKASIRSIPTEFFSPCFFFILSCCDAKIGTDLQKIKSLIPAQATLTGIFLGSSSELEILQSTLSPHPVFKRNDYFALRHHLFEIKQINCPLEVVFCQGISGELQKSTAPLHLAMSVFPTATSQNLSEGVISFQAPGNSEYYHSSPVPIDKGINHTSPFQSLVSFAPTPNAANKLLPIPEFIYFQVMINSFWYTGHTSLNHAWFAGDFLAEELTGGPLNIMVWGGQGSGKSSFLNGLATSFGFTEHVLSPLPVHPFPCPDSTMYTRHSIWSLQTYIDGGAPLLREINIQFWDPWGWEQDSLVPFVSGLVDVGTSQPQFLLKPKNLLQQSPDRIIDEIILVVPLSTALDNMSYLENQVQEAQNLGLHPVIVFSFVDQVRQEEVQSRVKRILASLHTTSGDTFVLANYVNEERKSWQKDSQYWSVLHRALLHATNYRKFKHPLFGCL